MTEPRTARTAARVLLVDARDRVLLFRGWDPARPGHRYWFTPGGGLEPGETMAAGAVRELFEETGLSLPEPALGAPVWHETTDFPFDGVWYRQEQDFFLVRVESWEVDTAGFDDVEKVSVDDHRWWSVPELATTAEKVYPLDLVPLLERVAGLSAATPVAAAVELPSAASAGASAATPAGAAVELPSAASAGASAAGGAAVAAVSVAASSAAVLPAAAAPSAAADPSQPSGGGSC
ncbi:NUDIX hydrolase [Spirilliplanes yamanashiensis]|uniref:Nudix hydrolase domain-containing protein n=1 Tax=Spirilliplanes yamanashiensis TaxID=42233 RepID=A0A8J4DGZ4_9ACTN|nr:NUDIX domain-containing protein [Spirilliplanes yamanashiensis]MDP9819699.1 8-oxo-dGTP pyrophosphatase MutT (NUDIX family) [Spirilliplanes yamanashiensis]GIJ01481.1 hypothetical protein Sya03_08330 [Spirilliplanes yamanashiensis]